MRESRRPARVCDDEERRQREETRRGDEERRRGEETRRGDEERRRGEGEGRSVHLQVGVKSTNITLDLSPNNNINFNRTNSRHTTYRM
jgi:hypothetical protein